MLKGLKGYSYIDKGFIYAPYNPFENGYRDHLEWRLKEYYKLINDYGYCPILLWNSMKMDEEFNRYNADKDKKEKNDPSFLRERTCFK